MKGIFLSEQKNELIRVYGEDGIRTLAAANALSPRLYRKDEVLASKEDIRDTVALFSTWGMPKFTKEEIADCFPNLKYIFYAAGSVQHFAREFLETGVRVFSAWQANAVPVAEYTFSLISLAAKGMFSATRFAKTAWWRGAAAVQNFPGNYGAKIGLLGCGMVGGAVAEKLLTLDVDVYCYDPFLSDEKAAALRLKKASLAEIFSGCDVISNHLADKDELAGLIHYPLLSQMKPHAVFINTGRGRQLDEKGLARALRETKTRHAILDVTAPEPPAPFSPLRRLKNVTLTPHIAGSTGNEVRRMAAYMADECARLAAGEAPLYEVTLKMLETMA